MDLLGSILDKMEKPPVIKKSEKEQEIIKKQQERLKQAEQAEKEKLRKFKQQIQSKLDTLVGTESEIKIQFEPMDNFFRNVVHGLAEDMELRSISFGFEGADRHVIVYKPQHFPCDDEIACLKRGETYDPEKMKKRKEAEENELKNAKQRSKVEIASTYQDKYKHLIGNEAGKSAAQIATPNSSFGVVPSSNKRDVRSIEQTLADIRKKKQKTAEVEAIDERDLDDESYDKSPGNQTSVEGTSRTD